MSGPHDRFIRYVFGHPERAAVLLSAGLPAGLAARVEWSSLRRESSAFVDPVLRGSSSDLSFSATVRGSSQPAFFLVEHQSRVDRRMAARVNRYAWRVLEAWEQQHPDSPYPLIAALVLYHGPPGPWSAPRRLEELFDIPLREAEQERWLKLLPRLEYALEDLTTRSEEELLALPDPPLVRLALVLLRHGRTGELNGRLRGWVSLFEQVYAQVGGEEDLGAVVCYLREIGDDLTDEVTRDVLRCFMQQKRAEELMQTVGERLRAEGRVEGEAKGEAKGLAKGRAEDVLRILAARGVPVEDAARQRILSCTDLPTLDRWFDRALSATRLSDVLGDLAQ